MKRESFVFYESFFDSIELLDRSIQAEILIALVRYGLRGEIEPGLRPVANALFMAFKPQIDKNNQRYLNGLKGREYGINGGRPVEKNPKKTPKKPQKNPKKTPNVNVNDNDNVNDIFIDKNIELTPLEKKYLEFKKFRVKKRKPILPESEQAFKKLLFELSGNNEDTAIKILDQSIANGWQGIFELKNNYNGNSKNNGSVINKQSERIKQNLATAARLAEKYEREGVENNPVGK